MMNFLKANIVKEMSSTLADKWFSLSLSFIWTNSYNTILKKKQHMKCMSGLQNHPHVHPLKQLIIIIISSSMIIMIRPIGRSTVLETVLDMIWVVEPPPAPPAATAAALPANPTKPPPTKKRPNSRCLATWKTAPAARGSRIRLEYGKCPES